MLLLTSLVILFAMTTTNAEPNPPTWPNGVYVFDPANSGNTQTIVDNAFSTNGGHNPPFNGQWSTKKFAFLFKPGTHNVKVNVGFYTSVIGLGRTPGDTTVTSFTSENGDFDYTGGALDNFWREVNNIGAGTTLWAVSQAAPLRRVAIRGDLALFQYNGGCCAGYASGGYLGDSVVTGTITSGSQQQWFTRNTQMKAWNGAVWNMVFVGSNAAPSSHCGNSGGNPYTTIAQTPVIAEKPYIMITAQGTYTLRVPRVEFGKTGPTTNFDNVDEHDFSGVYVAKESDTAAVINGKLSQGLHVILTPGDYQLSSPLTIVKDNQVILGIGFPTLTPTNGNAVISVGDVNGARVAGIIVQAGRQVSQTLIQWGATKNFGSATNPGFLHDIYGRVGGTNDPKQYQVSTNVVLTINHNYVVLDNSWLWRADHDITGNVVNSENPSFNGLVVNGDYVTMYGLAVEHHLHDGVVWNGENGQTFFYQCELPYDVTQQNFGAPGYVGYRVSQNVRNHTAFGVGVYSFFRDNTVTTPSGFVGPSGAKFVAPFTRFLSGNGQITHVLNNQGNTVNAANPMSYVC